jgi:putative flippase GtrA
MHLGINYLMSNTAAYTLGLVNSFLWNKYWTFKNKDGWTIQFGLFLISFILCYLIQLFCVFWGVEFLKMPKHLMQLAGMFVFTILNFSINKFVVFRPKSLKNKTILK